MTGIEAVEEYLDALCEKAEALKAGPSTRLARVALVEAECLAAALQAYLFRQRVQGVKDPRGQVAKCRACGAFPLEPSNPRTLGPFNKEGS